jgi:hypothetical protein
MAFAEAFCNKLRLEFPFLILVFPHYISIAGRVVMTGNAGVFSLNNVH